MRKYAQSPCEVRSDFFSPMSMITGNPVSIYVCRMLCPSPIRHIGGK